MKKKIILVIASLIISITCVGAEAKVNKKYVDENKPPINLNTDIIIKI